MAKKWTDEAIKALRLPTGRAEQRIAVQPGLYMRLRRRADGAASKEWEYRAQVDGTRRRLSLGHHPGVSLAQALAELLKHQAGQEAAKKGDADHPVIAARHARRTNKALPTVAEVFDEWLADKRMGSPRKRGEPVRERTITVLTENFNADVRARIGDAKIAKLTPEALRGCIDAPRKRNAPGAAAHVYRTLRGLTRFAISREYIAGADPMRGISNPRPYRPEPVNAASDAEILALLHAVDASHLWDSTKLVIEFQLLTGARPGEVRSMVWSEVNLDRSVWTLPAERVKSDRPFRVHLSTQALRVLERAKALANGCEYVFPGANGGAMEKMAVARALARLTERTEQEGGKKLRPHDLRRTFRTMLSRLGVAPHIAELCLGHVEKETMRRVYDGHDYSGEVAAAWDLAGSHIEALRRGGAQVVAINRARMISTHSTGG